MKRTETFKTTVEDLVCNRVGYNYAEIGWALEVGLSDTGVTSLNTKILFVILRGHHEDLRVPLNAFKLELVSDGDLEHGYQPESMVINFTDNNIQINF